jgi:nucleoside-diphosphate-sugar epimerase
MSDTPTLFCFGLGYTASALSRRLMAQGWSVRGTSRSEATCAELAGQGITVWPFDRDQPLGDPAAALEGVTHILISVPPDAAGDPVLDRHGADIAALSPPLQWAGYLSTTGVYGDRGGGPVDEASDRRPSTVRGERRVAAEDGWCALWRDRGVPVHLFRLAGIYGPGRNALETVRRGQAHRTVKPGQVFNRIHVDDISAVLEASMRRPNPGAAYNVCDDEAAPPQDVIAFACELLGVEPPPEVPFGEAEMTDMARSFYAENKRVANGRIKHELGVTLTYPDYRAGLRALL